jgi:hypothetical protein
MRPGSELTWWISHFAPSAGVAHEASRVIRGYSRTSWKAPASRARYLLRCSICASCQEPIGDHILADLPTADFFHELTATTAERVAGWSEHAKVLLAIARVDQMAEDLAHLEGTSLQGDAPFSATGYAGGATDDLLESSAESSAATVGARLSSEDLARLLSYQASGHIPRRRLRPAG